MNEYDMVAMIVFIVMASIVMIARYRHLGNSAKPAGSDGASKALEQEVAQLRDRINVLERIAVEKEDSLTRQIEQLRER